VARLSDTAADTDAPALPGDGLREGVVEHLRAVIGDQLLDTHLIPQRDLWIRVTPEAWLATGRALRDHGLDYFCFLSAIDWMPSPYGKGEDDPSAPPAEPDPEAGAVRQGVAGGDTRFQVLARLTDTQRHVGVTLKVDVPDTMTIESWVPVFAGANWHERETHEMFGIGFAGHRDLRNLYLPSEFEGHPLRKDFPLLARHVKPWPGLVDVEAMPGEPDEDEAAAEGATEGEG
jgi:NADH-quinone oxidoreductase subunit C